MNNATRKTLLALAWIFFFPLMLPWRYFRRKTSGDRFYTTYTKKDGTTVTRRHRNAKKF